MPKNTKKRKEKSADFAASTVHRLSWYSTQKNLLETKAETWEKASPRECRRYFLQGAQYVAFRVIHLSFSSFDSHCVAYPKHCCGKKE
jgi:hypothetical protein